ncbi:hypothetical protein WA026_004555 [Henosepilachna vigintioctopunctata]|uniref:PiggyBac transposable element-derived protein domain-containing protein n=1 Tax=Henosepilachna vigintioctopunctata TaxID=420089 RepID=A0AAW1VAL2_9CUCU
MYLNCLRFDNPDTRLKRQKENKTASISFVSNNCRKIYNMGINATIDEMLIGFRGRSHLIIYMPQKPAKYDLTVQANYDSKTFYCYDGYIYSGKGSGGRSSSCPHKLYTVEELKKRVPLMHRRFLYKHLPRELHATINRVLGADAPEDVREENQVAEGHQITKLCHICPSKLKRKTAYQYNTCETCVPAMQ